MTELPGKPTAADIIIAIARAEAGDWIDPTDEPLCWYAQLHPKGEWTEGEWYANGNAHSPAQAMAMAWLCYWAPDALIDAYVEIGSVPFDIPDEWEFRLTPPWQARVEV